MKEEKSICGDCQTVSSIISLWNNDILTDKEACNKIKDFLWFGNADYNKKLFHNIEIKCDMQDCFYSHHH